MNVSERGLAFVAQREACVLTAHRDTKNLAIGFGQNDPSLREGDTITLDEAVSRFVEASSDYDDDVRRVFRDMPLLQQHHDALFSVAYNIGGTQLRRAAALIEAVWRFSSGHTHRVNRDKAAYELTRVRFSVIDGPFNFTRRCREALMFISGDYGDLSTLKFWPVGKMPRNPDGTPKDLPEVIPMPRFQRG